jgi:PAS domain S-box-containing protein
MELAPVGIFYVDLDNNTTSINQKGLEITGLAAEDVKEKGWLKAVHPQDRKNVLARWQQSLETHQVFQSQHRFKHADGHSIWVSAQAVAERSATEKILGYVGTLIDISDAKQNENELIYYRHHLEEIVIQRTHQMERTNQQLQQELTYQYQTDGSCRERYALLVDCLDQTNDAVITLDKNQRIILLNPIAERLFGYAANEVRGIAVGKLLAVNFQVESHNADWLKEPLVSNQIINLMGKHRKGVEFQLQGTVTILPIRNNALYLLMLRKITPPSITN